RRLRRADRARPAPRPCPAVSSARGRRPCQTIWRIPSRRVLRESGYLGGAGVEEGVMSLAMSVEEREQFLAGLHVGVLSVSAGDDRGPISGPGWDRYQGGGAGHRVTRRNAR